MTHEQRNLLSLFDVIFFKLFFTKYCINHTSSYRSHNNSNAEKNEITFSFSSFQTGAEPIREILYLKKHKLVLNFSTVHHLNLNHKNTVAF